MWTAVKGSMDLPAIVAFLLDVLQEHQLDLQAIFITRELWLCVSGWIAPVVDWMSDDGTWH
jgi:hypothetical protein